MFTKASLEHCFLLFPTVIELCDLEPDTIPFFSQKFHNGKQQCVPVMSTDAQNTQSFLLKASPSLMTEATRPNESTLVQKMKQLSKIFKSEYALSSLQQFLVLLQMMFLKIRRNRLVLWIQFFHHLGCGLFIGLIFFNSANDGKRMFDHLKFCMGAIFFVVYTQVMVPILSCKLKS